MTGLGQLLLLSAFVTAGFSAFCGFVGWRWDHRGLRRAGLVAGLACVVWLTIVTAILAWALASKDFRFAYVAEYSSRDLPWHYALSALWVGQAGSLLVWAWFLGVVVALYRLLSRREPGPLREPALAVAMLCLWFLVAVMVFAADPMRPSLGEPREGAGLSPLMQHPAMLIHPPVVFAGYALWTIPFALAVAALLAGQLDATWSRQARPWILAAWVVLGVGILWGADWAYEELGWGGYWGWDPVENGSLIPWLTGTALLHTAMAWRYRGVMKKTSLLLAIATFGLCNFATFLTRSGIFSSLHDFSRSPIGWMFLGLMLALTLGGVALVVLRRRGLVPDRPIAAFWSREGLIGVSTVALLVLAGATLLGTLAVPLSDAVLGRKVIVGPAFYNYVLIPAGLVLLAGIGASPLVRWGGGGAWRESQAKSKVQSAKCKVQSEVSLAGLTFAFCISHFAFFIRRPATRHPPPAGGPRKYAGLLAHLGFVSLSIGVAGSSLGTDQRETVLQEGQTIQWAGRSIHFARVVREDRPEKLVVAAQLEISEGDAPAYTLLPAQHLHRNQNQWTSEVAIHSTWTSDFYAIVHGGRQSADVSFTFVVNPMMRWIWLSGWLAGAGASIGLWPRRHGTAKRQSASSPGRPEAATHFPQAA